MDHDPAISVVMPVFNTERYVALAVESILGQTFGDFEFIIIDDGSTDGSRAILEGYAAKDSRVRLVSRANTGYAVALNEGLGLARGEFVARMDSDDVSKPERFARQIEFMRGHPDVVAVGGQVVMVDPDGDLMEAMEHKPKEHAEIDAGHLSGRGGMIIHPAAMIRREAVEKVGGYRVEFEPAEDVDLFLRLGEIGCLGNISEVVLEYRIHLRNVSHTRATQQMRMVERGVAEARERRGLAPRPPRSFDQGDPTEADILKAWVRGAYRRGNYRMARKHALHAVRIKPTSLIAWRLFLMSCLGRSGRPFYRLWHFTKGRASAATDTA